MNIACYFFFFNCACFSTFYPLLKNLSVCVCVCVCVRARACVCIICDILNNLLIYRMFHALLCLLLPNKFSDGDNKVVL